MVQSLSNFPSPEPLWDQLPQPEVPVDDRSDIGLSFDIGMHQMRGVPAWATGVGASLFEKAGFQDAALRMRVSALEQAQDMAYDISQLEALYDGPSSWAEAQAEGTIGSYALWGINEAVKQVPNLATMALTAFATGGIGTIAMLTGRTAMVGMMSKIPFAAGSAVRGGQIAGVALGSAALNTGEIYSSALLETGENNPGITGLAGLLAGSLDLWPGSKVIRAMGRSKDLGSHIANKFLRDKPFQSRFYRALELGATEGLVEDIQTVIEGVTVNYLKDNGLEEEFVNKAYGIFPMTASQQVERIEARAAGGLLGALLGPFGRTSVPRYSDKLPEQLSVTEDAVNALTGPITPTFGEGVAPTYDQTTTVGYGGMPRRRPGFAARGVPEGSVALEASLGAPPMQAEPLVTSQARDIEGTVLPPEQAAQIGGLGPARARRRLGGRALAMTAKESKKIADKQAAKEEKGRAKVEKKEATAEEIRIAEEKAMKTMDAALAKDVSEIGEAGTGAVTITYLRDGPIVKDIVPEDATVEEAVGTLVNYGRVPGTVEYKEDTKAARELMVELLSDRAGKITEDKKKEADSTFVVEYIIGALGKENIESLNKNELGEILKAVGLKVRGGANERKARLKDFVGDKLDNTVRNIRERSERMSYEQAMADVLGEDRRRIISDALSAKLERTSEAVLKGVEAKERGAVRKEKREAEAAALEGEVTRKLKGEKITKGRLAPVPTGRTLRKTPKIIEKLIRSTAKLEMDTSYFSTPEDARKVLESLSEKQLDSIMGNKSVALDTAGLTVEEKINRLIEAMEISAAKPKRERKGKIVVKAKTTGEVEQAVGELIRDDKVVATLFSPMVMEFSGEAPTDTADVDKFMESPDFYTMLANSFRLGEYDDNQPKDSIQKVVNRLMQDPKFRKEFVGQMKEANLPGVSTSYMRLYDLDYYMTVKKIPIPKWMQLPDYTDEQMEISFKEIIAAINKRRADKKLPKADIVTVDRAGRYVVKESPEDLMIWTVGDKGNFSQRLFRTGPYETHIPEADLETVRNWDNLSPEEQEAFTRKVTKGTRGEAIKLSKRFTLYDASDQKVEEQMMEDERTFRIIHSLNDLKYRVAEVWKRKENKRFTDQEIADELQISIEDVKSIDSGKVESIPIRWLANLVVAEDIYVGAVAVADANDQGVSYVSLSDMSDAVYKNEGGEIVVPISQEKFKKTMVTIDPDQAYLAGVLDFIEQRIDELILEFSVGDSILARSDAYDQAYNEAIDRINFDVSLGAEDNSEVLQSKLATLTGQRFDKGKVREGPTPVLEGQRKEVSTTSIYNTIRNSVSSKNALESESNFVSRVSEPPSIPQEVVEGSKVTLMPSLHFKEVREEIGSDVKSRSGAVEKLYGTIGKDKQMVVRESENQIIERLNKKMSDRVVGILDRVYNVEKRDGDILTLVPVEGVATPFKVHVDNVIFKTLSQQALNNQAVEQAKEALEKAVTKPERDKQDRVRTAINVARKQNETRRKTTEVERRFKGEPAGLESDQAVINALFSEGLITKEEYKDRMATREVYWASRVSVPLQEVIDARKNLGLIRTLKYRNGKWVSLEDAGAAKIISVSKEVGVFKSRKAIKDEKQAPTLVLEKNVKVGYKLRRSQKVAIGKTEKDVLRSGTVTKISEGENPLVTVEFKSMTVDGESVPSSTKKFRMSSLTKSKKVEGEKILRITLDDQAEYLYVAVKEKEKELSDFLSDETVDVETLQQAISLAQPEAWQRGRFWEFVRVNETGEIFPTARAKPKEKIEVGRFSSMNGGKWTRTAPLITWKNAYGIVITKMRVDTGTEYGDTSVWEYLYEVYDPYNIRNVSNGTITYGSLKEAQKHYGQKSTYTLGSGKSKGFLPPEEIEEGVAERRRILAARKSRSALRDFDRKERNYRIMRQAFSLIGRRPSDIIEEIVQEETTDAPVTITRSDMYRNYHRTKLPKRAKKGAEVVDQNGVTWVRTKGFNEVASTDFGYTEVEVEGADQVETLAGRPGDKPMRIVTKGTRKVWLWKPQLEEGSTNDVRMSIALESSFQDSGLMPQYVIADAEETGMSVDALMERMSEAFGNRALNFIHVVKSQDQLPTNLQDSSKRIRAVAFNTDVWFVADNITDSRVIPLVLHEIGVHGFQSIMGKRLYQKLMGAVAMLSNTDGNVGAVYDRLAKEFPEANESWLVEETMGYIVENQAVEQNAFWRTLVDHILYGIARLKLFLNPKWIKSSDLLVLAKAAVKSYREASKVEQYTFIANELNAPMYSMSDIFNFRNNKVNEEVAGLRESRQVAGSMNLGFVGDWIDRDMPRARTFLENFLVVRNITQEPESEVGGRRIRRVAGQDYQVFVGDNVKRWFHNYFNDIETLEKSIERRGGKLSIKNMASLFHGAYKNVVNYKRRSFHNEYVNLLADYMQEHKVDGEDLHNFLYARHAPHANRKLKKKNGVEDGSGISDAVAENMLVVLKKKLTDEQWVNLHNAATMVYSINNYRIIFLRDEGLISEKDVEKWLADKEYNETYVPLREKGDSLADEIFGETLMPSPISVQGLESKYRTGRYSPAGNTWAWSVMQVDYAIDRAEKNKVVKAFARMVRENEDDLKKDIQVLSPDAFKRAKEFESGEVLMEGLYSNMVTDPAHHITFKVDGETYHIISRDKRIGEAFNRSNMNDSGVMMQLFAQVNRFFSAIHTTLSPEFILTNFIRDIQTGLTNLQSELKEGSIRRISNPNQLTKQVVKDLKVAGFGLKEFIRDKKTDSEWAKMAELFSENGGRIDFFAFRDAREFEKSLNVYIKDTTPNGARRFRNKVLEFMGDYNAVFENTIRLSVFKNAREALMDNGMTEIQANMKAADIARNLTVNFSNKGEKTQAFNSLYLFFNAGVQGTVRLFQAMMRRAPSYDEEGRMVGAKGFTRVQKIMGSIALLGFSNGILNALLAGDDEDGVNRYRQVDLNQRQRQMHIYLPGFDTFVKIPLPYGYNIPYVLGDTVSAMMMGHVGPGKASLNLLNASVESFIPFSWGGSDTAIGTAVKTATPQFLDPALDLAMNESFFGGPIYKDPAYGSADPPSERYWSNTGGTFKTISRALNALTGGSKVEAGVASIEPDILEFFWETYAGSAGRFVERSYDLVWGISPAGRITHKETGDLNWSKIPLGRRFFYDETATKRGFRYEKYAEYVMAIRIADGVSTGIRRTYGFGSEWNSFKKGTDYKLSKLNGLKKSTEGAITKLYKARAAINRNRMMSSDAKEERTDALQERMNKLRDRLINKVDEVMGET